MFYLRASLISAWFLCTSSLLVVLGFIRLTFAPHFDVDRIIARLFGTPALKLAGIKIEVENLAGRDAHQPCVFVGNHQSTLDLMTFGSIFPPRTLCIGKKELLWIPFFGVGFWAAGNVLLDRSNRSKAIDRLADAVTVLRDKKWSIIIFPEGTRNHSGHGMLPFKKGAFHLAAKAGVPIVPIVCSRVLHLADFKRHMLKSGTLRMRVLPAIPVTADTDIEKLASEVREKMLAAYEELSGIR